MPIHKKGMQCNDTQSCQNKTYLDTVVNHHNTTTYYVRSFNILAGWLVSSRHCVCIGCMQYVEILAYTVWTPVVHMQYSQIVLIQLMTLLIMDDDNGRLLLCLVLKSKQY